VEQKNNAVVRTAVGYLRYDTQEQERVLNQIYANVRLLVNFFYPSTKLIEKVRQGARVRKRYDAPRTPYQRALDSQDIPLAAKEKLRAQLEGLNPAAALGLWWPCRRTCSEQPHVDNRSRMKKLSR
jgi:hypothetical protein